MNLLRRLLVLIYGLALLALVTVALLFPEVIANALLAFGDTSQTARAIVVAVIDLAIVIALFLVIRSPRREELDGLIVKTPGARADINIASARDLILKAVRDVPNVVSAEAKLTAPAGRADIDLAVEVVGSDVNVPNKQREIDRALRQVALKQLGLQLATQPRVHIQLVTEEELRAREAAFQPHPLPPEPPAASARETWTPAPAVTPAPEAWTAAPVEAVAPAVTPVAETTAPPAEPVVSNAPVPAPVAEEPAAPALSAPVPSPAAWDEREQAEDLFVVSDSEVTAPVASESEAADDNGEALSLDTVVPLAEEPSPANEIDASVLDDIDPDHEDWLNPDSSLDDTTGLYAADDERSRREAGEQPPLPDLD